MSHAGGPLKSTWVLTAETGFHPWARLREAWSYRRLVGFFGSHAFAMLYKRTHLGILWVPLRPLAPLLIVVVFYGGLMKIPSGGVPYFLMFIVATCAWSCFDGPWMWGSRGLELHRDLMAKLYFPRIVLPLSTTVPGFVEPVVALVVAIVAVVYYRIADGVWYVVFGPQLLLAPLLLLLIVAFAFGMSLFTSPYQVRARDVRFIMGYILGFWMLLTPVIYPITVVDESWRWLMWLNPMAPPVEAFKALLLGWPAPPQWALSVSIAEVVIVLLAGTWHFLAMEAKTNDKI